MARNLTGATDGFDCGTDASVNDYHAGKTISFWVRRASSGAVHSLLGKDFTNSQWLLLFQSSNDLRYAHQWSTGLGSWIGTTTFTSSTALNHIAVVYDASSTTNDATIYVNGTAEALTTDTNPTGTVNSDASDPLKIGVSSAGAGLNGDMLCVVLDDRAWTAAQVRLARWWGRPLGGIQVYHPFFTDKLNNEGAATADATATATTVVSMAAPVVRPGTAMMGTGVGW